MIKKMLNSALQGIGCSAAEARTLLACDERELFEAATQIREAFFGNEVQLCSIINAKSGRCDMDCRFCSQSGCSTTQIDVYPFLDSETLNGQIRALIDAGDRRCGVVTSGGRLSPDEIGSLCATVRPLAGAGAPPPVCASLGRLRSREFEALRAAGITRYHHNLETSRAFYPQVCTTQQWSERRETVRAAQAAGLDICSGGLFGLGESWDDRIDLALSLRELEVDSVPINFLYAHPGTSLRAQEPLSAAEALRLIALYRFLLPRTTLRVCGGRAHVLGARQSELFAAGANGLMTGDYLTVAGSQYEADLAMVESLHLQVVAR